MRRVVVALAVLGGLAEAQAAGVHEEPCHVDGFETPVRCVSISVPLDHDTPYGARTMIGAAIVPAATARPAGDPLIVLAGGPGQASTGMGPWLNSAFKRARQSRDIVLFDIRGTGRSGQIACAFSLTATAGGIEQTKRDAAACARRFGPRAAFYSAREAVEDLERFRRAQGWDRVSLWGGSFGTRIAQHYVRKYGAHVRAVVLDGATPAGASIFATGPETGQRALELMLQACARDAACAAAFPRLKADFDDLLLRADRAGLALKVGDPRSGRMRSALIDRDGVVGLVRGALYVGMTRAMVPYAIDAGARGDLRPLLALGAATAEWSADTMSLGVMLGIICAEDLAQARMLDPVLLSAGFMRDSYYRYFAEACASWPSRELPAPMLAPLAAKVPAMVISGNLDPVTPPSLGAQTLKQFTSGVHVVIPHGFHTNSSDPCVAGIIASFLSDPDRGGRDHACVNRTAPPRFITSPNA